ncbi:hypothetical protein OF83DRAFT_1179677 [Amylostereum chailletii]|nr:hypothetical protein OF83DRAFT_1179677 [Amylostereum chailletii]
MFFSASLLSLASAVLVSAHPTSHSSESVARALPGAWHHTDDHPVHALFRRQSSGATSFPKVGSPEWSAGFPTAKPDSNQIPQAWKDALNAAVQSGKIPGNVPVSRQTAPGTNPIYDGVAHPEQQPVCSSTYKCRSDGQLWDAPNGTIGISFDDGPLPTSDGLYTFLQQNNIPSTHFFIGVNILGNPNEFTTAYQTLQADLAVHTWTHPYMTTLSNADVVAELGYTLALIYNSTNGRLARYWRPPYGDSDVRVDAIAREVFGLTTVIWNQDTEDWSIGQATGTTASAIAASFQKWLTGPKSPGLIVLEHELSAGSVGAFEAAYPVMKSNGWQPVSVAQISGLGTYQNAANSTSPVVAVSGPLAGANNGAGISSLVGAASSSSAAAASTTTAKSASKTGSAASSTASVAGGADNSNSQSGGAVAASPRSLAFFATMGALVLGACVA